MAAIGNVAKHGFLVREGDALERLAKVTKITFDKTGTLTYGMPQVIKVRSVLPNISENELYSLCAAAEKLSEHPLGKAVVRGYKQEIGKALSPAEDFKMLPGRGVSAIVCGKNIFAGNREMLSDKSIDVPSETASQIGSYLAQGCTVIYAAIDGSFAGYIALSDTIRKESTAMIRELTRYGVQPVLLTGDNKNAASAIAEKLGIEEFSANFLPEDKLNYIKKYQENNNAVCMIGDGVNDAPALKAANVGIAMGGVGSDIAADAADIVLIDDEVKELPHLIALSKRMMTTIKLNLIFSMTLNFIAIALAISGILNPVVGALVHNAGSVIVIINSAFLLKWKRKK